MSLDQQYLQELSELFLRNLRKSDFYAQMAESERFKLENKLQLDAAKGFIPLIPGAAQDDLENLMDAVEEELNIELPTAVVEILRQADGFSFNGVCLYGVDPELCGDGFESGPGILAETALQWSDYPEAARSFLFVGDSDLWYFAIELSTQMPVALERSTHRIAHRFRSAEEMVNDMLRTALGIFDEKSDSIGGNNNQADFGDANAIG